MEHACAKVILSGEHTVVYGAPALVTGIDLGVQAWAQAAAQAELVIDGQHCSPNTDTGRAFAALLGRLDLGACRVDLELKMPVGVGLGASAAMAVASARAVARHHQRKLTDSDVLAAADAWERVFHGDPSGVDAAAAHFGGCLRYERASGARRLALSDDLTLLIAVAGPPSATKQMVEQVAGFRERDPARFSATLQAIVELTEAMQQCLSNGDTKPLGALLDQNHELLARWGLSTPALETCRNVAKDAGASGSKLTGAGGGGCVIAVAEAAAQTNVLQAWQRKGFRAFRACVRGGAA